MHLKSLLQKLSFAFSIALFYSVSFIGQDLLVYDDFIYREEIKTPMCYINGDLLSAPFIELGSGNLKVRFDELGDEVKDYYYTVIHCDFQWNPSDLDKSDFMTGFFENSISESEFSFSTKQDYVHYQFDFPNDMAGVSISGNYLLVVYEDGDEEKLVLSRRFVVYEQKLNIETNIKAATAIKDARFRQEVDVNIISKSYKIDNPYSDFKIAILQNNRWDNAITNLTPRFVKNDELVYDYSEENVFDGGNEFREFNLTDLNFVTNQVAKIELYQDEWWAHLRTDPNRAYKVYTYNKDLNGNFYIVNNDGFEQHVEEDYVHVRFVLDSSPFQNSKVFFTGKFSDYKLNDEFLMTYDSKSKRYFGEAFVKQGFYNYQYVVRSNNDQKTDVAIIEGNHFATFNLYTVLAYNTDFVAGYDRVVGIKITDSINR